ncbi:HlyD family efflux transporter periplasmic adaptor subunit [Nostoc sp. FACHB-152]|uniref:HlyD family efflux transporter periplasmic adaptor subunit n=1 Tax=unclassified Nostoc TaxID=2593658 RepID=UPI0016832558|nr:MULTISPECIES: HlyD family efflux transporter periplasmic adaptor subunit [unclassified Nostoc]MBD2448164.1 HlyD family efflux transporter periplasmic adaptor subunit [Nostoc sp. FACHB-152]MBD2470559.1 HlyD family efflux transporter periplasmic adaptor subunit [Nostoc sp. FACHB-145]
MPDPSWNSSTALTTSDEDALKNYYQPEAVKGTIEVKNLETANDTNDWSHSTEELLDALPKRWAHSLLYFLIGFAVLVLPWTMLSKVDETGNARGRIEPKGAAQRIDSAVSGNVTAVKVKEGQTVAAGQVLVELETGVLKTELQQVQAKLEGQQNRLMQLNLLKNQLELSIRVQEQQNQSQELEKLAQLNQAQQNLDAKQSTYNLQKLEKQALVNQAQQQINSAQNDQNSAQSRLTIDSRQVERFNQIVKAGAVSENQVDQLKKEQQESKRLYEQATSDIKQAKLRLAEEQNRYQTTITQLESEIQQAKLRLQEVQNSYKSLQQAGKLTILKSQEQLKDLQTQIAVLRSEIMQSRSQIISLKLQLGQRILRSPVDGTVFTLPISKPGSVVQPGQMIAQIAPKNTAYVLKAQMPSQESGFLKKGMPVKIKFDAYPFQDYGVVKGHVNWISPDSKIQETNQGKIEIYELEITLNHPYIESGNKRIDLLPGQTATAEVIVRQRRVIDFVLDPFKKLQKGGLEL